MHRETDALNPWRSNRRVGACFTGARDTTASASRGSTPGSTPDACTGVLRQSRANGAPGGVRLQALAVSLRPPPFATTAQLHAHKLSKHPANNGTREDDAKRLFPGGGRSFPDGERQGDTTKGACHHPSGRTACLAAARPTTSYKRRATGTEQRLESRLPAS